MARTVVIDGAGRIVIPKDVRESQHLHAGRRLKLLEEAGRIVLEAIERDDELIEKDGLLLVGSRVLRGPPLVRDVREERIDELLDRIGSKTKKTR